MPELTLLSLTPGLAFVVALLLLLAIIGPIIAKS